MPRWLAIGLLSAIGVYLIVKGLRKAATSIVENHPDGLAITLGIVLWLLILSFAAALVSLVAWAFLSLW